MLVTGWRDLDFAPEHPVDRGGVRQHERHPQRGDDQRDLQRLLAARDNVRL
jgi:hypothetical protein